ncbi:hypothetical protein [Dasania marina]|uniref:hypothetical protein n=1 Tax=Dasania marina TaxID=471499 RepID=UPI00055D3A25|nr:hypothetical protein [Dasania marina]
MRGLYSTVLVVLLALSQLCCAQTEPAEPQSPGVIEQLLDFFGLAEEPEEEVKPADANASAKAQATSESKPESLSPSAQEQLSDNADELLPIHPLDLKLPEGGKADDTAIGEFKSQLPNLFGKPAQRKPEAGRISVSGKPLLKFGETYTEAPKVEGADISIEMIID